ncbi:hypothetical protein AB0C27_53795 [Nonomuraea sp. NPDC048882]|uniref:hypothetical protein n=1 Tax=Nonomuraea sp. NPDC048882 TaxID=3154347 RepID=UPI003400AFE5
MSTAVSLADTSEIAGTAAAMIGRCQATGIVVASYRGLIAAAVTLGMQPALRGRAWPTDTTFVTALVDLECDLFSRLTQVNAMIDRLVGDIEWLESQYTGTPETEIYLRRSAVLRAALDVLIPAQTRLNYALGRVMAVPEELGETYAAACAHVRSGRQLPFNGRWITGRTAG